jgi:hypothetical protein
MQQPQHSRQQPLLLLLVLCYWCTTHCWHQQRRPLAVWCSKVLQKL